MLCLSSLFLWDGRRRPSSGPTAQRAACSTTGRKRKRAVLQAKESLVEQGRFKSFLRSVVQINKIHVFLQRKSMMSNGLTILPDGFARQHAKKESVEYKGRNHSCDPNYYQRGIQHFVHMFQDNAERKNVSMDNWPINRRCAEILAVSVSWSLLCAQLLCLVRKCYSEETITGIAMKRPSRPTSGKRPEFWIHVLFDVGTRVYNPIKRKAVRCVHLCNLTFNIRLLTLLAKHHVAYVFKNHPLLRYVTGLSLEITKKSITTHVYCTCLVILPHICIIQPSVMLALVAERFKLAETAIIFWKGPLQHDQGTGPMHTRREARSEAN